MLKNIFKVLGSNFLVTVIGLCNSFILPKLLSIDDFAVYQTFTLYMTYTAILHLGFPSGMFIKYGGKKFGEIDKAEFKTEYNIILIILSIFTVIGLFVAIMTQSSIFVLVIITILPYCIVGSFKSLYQAWGEFQKYSIINSAIPFGTLIAYLGYFILFKKLSSNVTILAFIFAYYIVFIYILSSTHREIKGIKANKYISRENSLILGNGFLLMIGSYINTLFLSVDKQYIKIFFTNTEFAIYSFAMSMQAIMVVFITSIAQPLFPKMAGGTLSNEKYKDLEEILFIFGSLSGCAYYVCAFIVEYYIPKYIDSIDVIGYYFVVFPVVAVINCLIINLYKVHGIVMKYMKSLIIVLSVAILLGAFVIIGGFGYKYIALTSAVTYFVWFLIGVKDFAFLKPNVRDYIFLILFIVLYFTTINLIENAIIGFFAYLVLDIMLVLVVYNKKIKNYLKLVGIKNV